MKKGKRTLIAIPVDLSDKEIVELANSMVEIRKEQIELEKRESDLKDEIKEKKKDIDFTFNQLVEGQKEVEMTLRVRKNFEKTPPVIEYLDDNDRILRSDIMLPEQFQLESDDWSIGQAGDAPEVKPNDKSKKDKKAVKKPGKKEKK